VPDVSYPKFLTFSYTAIHIRRLLRGVGLDTSG